MNKVDATRKENNEFSKSLTKENQEIYTDIVCYLRVSGLSEESQEEVISDVLRIFLDCQEQGNSIQDVIGEDYKKFTDDIIIAINPTQSILDKIKGYLQVIVQGVCILQTLELIFNYLPRVVKGNYSINYDYTLDMVISFILIIAIGTFIVKYIGKNSFRITKYPLSKWKKFIIGCSAGTLFIILGFLPILFKNILIVSINIYYIVAILLMYWGYMAVKKVVK